MIMESIRPSIGTAILLGLSKGGLPVPPTTAYLMLGEGCSNDCGFCTQARSSSSASNRLSRVTWPSYPLVDVLSSLERSRELGLQRICIQCLNDVRIKDELPDLVTDIFNRTEGLPISISISTNDKDLLRSLRSAGVDRVGIAVDVADPELFEKIKGRGAGNPFGWEEIWDAIKDALEVFGPGSVSTHLIIGMGETDHDAFRMMKRCSRIGILLSLFSYTPMKGTRMTFESPSLARYRSIQFMRMMVMERGITEGFDFNEKGRLIGIPEDAIDSRTWIMTRGCSGCNRPYYNERPRGPMYNHPTEPSGSDLEEALDLVMSYVSVDRE